MQSVDGLYGHGRANTLKSAALVIAFVPAVLLAWIGLYVVNGLLLTLPEFVFGLPLDNQERLRVTHKLLAAVAAGVRAGTANLWVPVAASVSWLVVAYVFHETFVRLGTGARALSRFEAPRLFATVEALAIRNGLPVPRIEIIETAERNAYASGLSPKRATIAVTRGLLDTLDPRELEAVLAHEFAHIVNRDTQLMLVITIFIGGVAALGAAAWNVLKERLPTIMSGRGAFVLWFAFSGVLLMVMLLLVSAAIVLSALYVASSLMRAAVSRAREYLADAAAVEMTRDPDALVSALVAIYERPYRPAAATAAQSMMIAGAWDDWFATHPPIAERIAALQRHAGALTPRQHMTRARREVAQSAPGPGGGRAAFGKRRAARIGS